MTTALPDFDVKDLKYAKRDDVTRVVYGAYYLAFYDHATKSITEGRGPEQLVLTAVEQLKSKFPGWQTHTC